MENFSKDGNARSHCLLRNLYAVQEATIGTRHRPTDWLKIGKGVQQGLYCHPAWLTYRQSTDCEMSGWMNDKLELRLPREIPTISHIEMITLQWQKVKFQ